MRGIFVSLIIVILLCSSVFAVKVDTSIDNALLTDDEVNVIIKLKDSEVKQKSFSAVSKKLMIKNIQDQVLSNTGFKAKHRFSSVNVLSGKITRQDLEKLEKDSNVESIFFDRPVHAFLDASIPLIKANNVWQLQLNSINLTGSGQTICVIDSGINYNHSALGNGWGNKVIGGYDFVNNDADPMDDYGHGTHCAGIVASDNETYKGVAPDTKIIVIKALDGSGSGSISDIDAGIEWCVNNANEFNISVISMSLGTNTSEYGYDNYCDYDWDTTATHINNAIAQNITVVVASGNDNNYTHISSPACIQNATPIGATTKSDILADYSNLAPILDIVAPGSSITSSLLNGGFGSMSGTSMATPHVAGIIALINQFMSLQNSSITPQEIEYIINLTGVLVNDSNTNKNYSRINIYSAILYLDSTSPNINLISPTPINYTITPNTSIEINTSIIDQINNISSCWLEWNYSSNNSMTKLSNGTSVNCYINYSITGFGLFNYRVFANDSNNNIGSSELRQFIIDTAPNITSFYPNITSFSIVEPNNQSFNISYNDLENNSIFVVWYLNGSSVGNSDNYTFFGNYSSDGDYNITVIVDDGFLTNSMSWNMTINNTNLPPQTTSVIINSTDSLNRTNGSLQGSWTFFDSDNNSEQSNETKWFNNSVEILPLTNLTLISSDNATKNDSWIFSVRVFDGVNWSSWYNSSALTIQNAAPELSLISNITVNETNLINITVSASDIDGDNLTYSINDSRFTQISNSFTWQTNLTDDGIYTARINVTDQLGSDYQNILITILDSIDSDGDGNPDNSDTDDDNDGINDTLDFLTGNSSSINSTTMSINLTINGTTNLSQVFNQSLNVLIKENNTVRVGFNFNFTASTLNLYNITIEKQNNSNYGSMLIKGLSLSGQTKFVLVDDLSSINSICIKDAEIDSINDISAACNSTNETLVVCNSSLQNGYNCTDIGDYYNITGLSHSGIKEQCSDNDGDGYGENCPSGSDFDDSDATKYVGASCSRSCYSGSSYDSSGSCTGGTYTCETSSSSGGGGGGGSGSKVSSSAVKKSNYYNLITPGDIKTMKISDDSFSVTKNVFSTNKQVLRVTVAVETVPESEVPSVVKNAYDYFKISLTNMESKDVNNATIEFKVNNSWLVNFDKNLVSLNRYTSSWEVLETELISEDSLYTYYSSKTPGFSYFAISAEKSKQEIEDIKTESIPGDVDTEVKETITNLNITTPKEELVPEVKEDIKIEKVKQDPTILYFVVLIVFVIGMVLYFEFKHKKKSHK